MQDRGVKVRVSVEELEKDLKAKFFAGFPPELRDALEQAKKSTHPAPIRLRLPIISKVAEGPEVHPG
jgi:hypothetical protein